MAPTCSLYFLLWTQVSMLTLLFWRTRVILPLCSPVEHGTSLFFFSRDNTNDWGSGSPHVTQRNLGPALSCYSHSFRVCTTFSATIHGSVVYCYAHFQLYIVCCCTCFLHHAFLQCFASYPLRRYRCIGIQFKWYTALDPSRHDQLNGRSAQDFKDVLKRDFSPFIFMLKV